MTRAILVFAMGALVFALGVWQVGTMPRPLSRASDVAAKQLPRGPDRRQASYRPQVRVQVTVRGLSYVFSPERVTVRVGTTVTWENRTAAGHTATSVTPRLFDKHFGGYQDASMTFTKPGIYPYYCAIHPYMLGVVVVRR